VENVQFFKRLISTHYSRFFEFLQHTQGSVVSTKNQIINNNA